MVALSQHDDNLVLLALMAWAGALLCMEDQLPSLTLRPSQISLLVGTALLTWGFWRIAIIQDLDGIAWLLPPLLGIGLMGLARPLRQPGGWLAALAALAMVPVSRVFLALLPEAVLSTLTARLAQLLLLLMGSDVVVNGRQILLPGGAVVVGAQCSGNWMMAQSLMIAGIFALAFPMPRQRSLPLLLLSSCVIAWLVNVIRILSLAVINASGIAGKTWWFDFVHEGAGSLIFSGVAVSLYGWLYLQRLERQLQQLEHPDRHG
jgi:exosortase/archaeosortase family protein